MSFRKVVRVLAEDGCCRDTNLENEEPDFSRARSEPDAQPKERPLMPNDAKLAQGEPGATQFLPRAQPDGSLEGTADSPADRARRRQP